jgi:hypothetical protein
MLAQPSQAPVCLGRLAGHHPVERHRAWEASSWVASRVMTGPIDARFSDKIKSPSAKIRPAALRHGNIVVQR